MRTWEVTKVPKEGPYFPDALVEAETPADAVMAHDDTPYDGEEYLVIDSQRPTDQRFLVKWYAGGGWSTIAQPQEMR